MIKRYNIIRRY